MENLPWSIWLIVMFFFKGVAVLGIALIAMGEEIGSEMALRTFGHLVSSTASTVVLVCLINVFFIPHLTTSRFVLFFKFPSSSKCCCSCSYYFLFCLNNTSVFPILIVSPWLLLFQIFFHQHCFILIILIWRLVCHVLIPYFILLR